MASKKSEDEMPDTVGNDRFATTRRGPSRYAGRRLEMPLAGVRAAAGATQADVAERSGIAQGEVSKLEAREDLDRVELGTIRRYLEALGADLELVAIMKNGARVALREAIGGRELARNLRAARERAGLTQKELAERMNVVEHLVHRFESGVQEPSAAYCRRVWAICGAAGREGSG